MGKASKRFEADISSRIRRGIDLGVGSVFKALFFVLRTIWMAGLFLCVDVVKWFYRCVVYFVAVVLFGISGVFVFFFLALKRGFDSIWAALLSGFAWVYRFLECRALVSLRIVVSTAILGFFGYQGVKSLKRNKCMLGSSSHSPLVAMVTPAAEVLEFESVATEALQSSPTQVAVVATDSLADVEQEPSLSQTCQSVFMCENTCRNAPCILMSTIRHVVGEGVGFEDGYTSMEQLLFPIRDDWDLWPFLDFRMHVFNDADLAANVGGGFRYFSECSGWVYGVNAFYDFREAYRNDRFSQFGVGFELLTGCWDIRVNGYLPVRDKKLARTCDWTYPGGYFIEKKVYVESRRGFDLEVGSQLLSFDLFRSRKTNCATPLTVYAAVGPYYYRGEVDHFVGAQGRLKIDLGRYFSLEGRVTRDSYYKTRINGIISIHFPLGCSSANTCAETILSQPIRRNEIIDVNRFCKWRWNY